MPKTYFLLKTAYNATRKQLDQYLAPFGLTSAQMDIMMTLLHSGQGLEQRKLQIHLGISAPTLTGIIDGMIARNIVTRQTSLEDARVKQLSLTEQGFKLVKQSAMSEEQFAERFYHNFSPTEIAALDASLKKLLSNMHLNEDFSQEIDVDGDCDPSKLNNNS